MTDINFMDVFFGSGNTISHLEKDCKLERKDEDQLDWITDDFLDSILNSCTEGSNPLLDQFLTNENDSANSFMECSSDSGLSHEPDSSPITSIRSEDDFLYDPIPKADSLVVDSECLPVKNDDVQNTESTVDATIELIEAVDYVKEEEVECEEVHESIYIIDDDSIDGDHDTFIIEQIDHSDDDTNLSSANFSSDNSIPSPKHELCEVVNAVPCPRNKRFKTNNYSNIQRLQKKRKFSDVTEGTTSDDSDSMYPRLRLTPEEQKLATKEGIKLPAHHPLTKSEERELKRIRRKIRNKISAQDSRRRKKEYVDGLEERVERTSEENASLMKRIKTLENQKLTLVAQVKKLQAMLARCSGQTAQPSTCLLVLVMSLALILAPNLRNTAVSSDSTDDEGISLSEDGSSSLHGDRPSSRNLLFSQKNIEGSTDLNEETAKMLTEQLEKMQMADGNVLTSALEMLKFAKSDSSLKEHDYFRPRKRLAADSTDGPWSSSKMYAKMVSEIKNIASSFGMAEKKKTERLNSVEPIIIDLSAD